jgi:phosphatidylcholine synthase
MAWLAHLYTALGAVLALYATLAVFDGEFKAAIVALAAAMFVDASDGWLARGLRVKEVLPGFDGARLDDIIDYLTYTFVPVLLVIEAGLLPEGWAIWVGGVVLVASAYGFAQADAKIQTTDHFFTGFPSYWNFVAFYMYVLRPAPMVNAVVLLVLAILVFVPIRYVYPSRTVVLRVPTLMLAFFWGVVGIVMIWRLPATDGPWTTLSLVFPVYYFALSLWLHGRDREEPPRS